MISLDKSLTSPVSLTSAIHQGFGLVAIRVVVLQKTLAAAPSLAEIDDMPADATPDETLSDREKKPVSTFLEDPKRGHQVCVFLINGQRQHAWDNQFITRDLGLKYLRHRMLVIVDCDGLRPEAIADLMQGSRSQFYQGKVYAALESRVVATLKGDPDLRRLEEEAEDDIANLQAGDEAVKATLDQLIEAHHEAADHASHGLSQPGESTRNAGAPGGLEQSQDVVVEEQPNVGKPASEPVLQLRPDIATIRLKPNDARKYQVVAKPDAEWKQLETLAVTFDPPIKELQVTRTARLAGEELSLLFAEPEDFDDDEYPIETFMRATAVFKSVAEPRILERRVVITPQRTVSATPPKPPVPLSDDPTFIRVTSRQPIKILVGGADVHVKLRWNGKDELLAGNPPEWTLRVACESTSVEPQTFLTKAANGRFELLIQAAPGLKAGEQLKFDVEAIGPGKTLTTAFLADVAEPLVARRIPGKTQGGGQRRPPYQLVYVERQNWTDGNAMCFDEPWSGQEAGSFDEPDATTPLTIFINKDMDLLVAYRESLLAKRLQEATIQQRVNKYTAHVAFHLYQMYQKKRQADKDQSLESASEDLMRDEVRRVAHTLIKLMEVSQ